MMDKKYIEEMTQVYIVSYQNAMETVNNPAFATQIASSVLMVAEMRMKTEQKQMDQNTLNLMINAAFHAMDRMKNNTGSKKEDPGQQNGQQKSKKREGE